MQNNPFCMNFHTYIDVQSIKTMQIINPTIAVRSDQPLWYRLRLFCCTQSSATLSIGGAVICNKTCIFICAATNIYENKHMSAENKYVRVIYMFDRLNIYIYITYINAYIAWKYTYIAFYYLAPRPRCIYICIYIDIDIDMQFETLIYCV